jgi:hypothetical protein
VEGVKNWPKLRDVLYGLYSTGYTVLLLRVYI